MFVDHIHETCFLRIRTLIWGAVEWLLFNVKAQSEWEDALHNFLVVPRLRYVQVRHWGSIKDDPMAIKAIQRLIAPE